MPGQRLTPVSRAVLSHVDRLPFLSWAGYARRSAIRTAVATTGVAGMDTTLLGEEIGDLSRGGGSAEAHRRDTHTVQAGWVGPQVLDLGSELPLTADR